jgi:hypothetical protein
MKTFGLSASVKRCLNRDAGQGDSTTGSILLFSTLSKQAIAGIMILAGFLIGSPVQAQQLSIFENLTLSPGFSPDPVTIHGISGGPQAASEISNRADTATGLCVGYVDEQPDHTIELTQFFGYLSIQVESPQDTTLVVRGPGGSWCNDDYTSSNPGLAGQWLSGTYQVWVGSYDPNSYQPYVIRVTQNR